MTNTIPTKLELENGKKNLLSWDTFINGSAAETVTRLGASNVATLSLYLEYLNGFRQLFEQDTGSVTVNGVQRLTLNQAINDALSYIAVGESGVPDSLVAVTKTVPGTVARSQRDKNSSTLTPYDFGLIGSFSTLTLADKFDSLEAAKEVYQNAVSLTELHDRVVLDRFLMHIRDTPCQGVSLSGEVLLDKPLISYTAAKTLLMGGDLTLASHQSKLAYCFHVATPAVVHTGAIRIKGKTLSADITTRLIKHGVVFGALSGEGLTGNGANCVFKFISGDHILGFAHLFGTNCHFSSVTHVRGSNCGSARKHSSMPRLQGVADAFTSSVFNGKGNLNQLSILSIPDLSMTPELEKIDSRLLAHIEGEIYSIRKVDYTTNEVSIYPILPAEVTTGDITYLFGGASNILSSNTACTTITTLQAIVCGKGLNSPSLYGTHVGNLITEFCGAGLYQGGTSETHLGTIIGCGYFEGNLADVVVGWALQDHSALVMSQSIALNPAKIISLFPWRSKNIRVGYGGGQIPSGYINIAGTNYTKEKDIFEITRDNHCPCFVDDNNYSANKVIQLTLAYDIARLTGNTSKVFYFGTTKTTTNRIITLKAPVGYTLNGLAEVVVNLHEYDGVVSVLASLQTIYDDAASSKINHGFFANQVDNQLEPHFAPHRGFTKDAANVEQPDAAHL